MSLKKLSLLFLILFTTTKLFAADNTVNQYNFFVGGAIIFKKINKKYK